MIEMTKDPQSNARRLWEAFLHVCDGSTEHAAYLAKLTVEELAKVMAGMSPADDLLRRPGQPPHKRRRPDLDLDAEDVTD